jgi:hypothetical protein
LLPSQAQFLEALASSRVSEVNSDGPANQLRHRHP